MTNSDSIQPAAAQSLSCFDWVIHVAFWFWIIFLISIRYGIEIFASAISPDNAGANLAYLPLVQATLIALPALLLSLVSKNQRSRTIFRLWFSAALYIFFLLPANYSAPDAMQQQAIWHIASSMLFISLIWLIYKRKTISLPETPARKLVSPPVFDHWLPAMFLVLSLYTIPWVLFGALGSLLDSFLQLAAGLLLGCSAAFLIELQYFHQNSTHTLSRFRTRLVDILVIGTTLGIMISAFGYSFSITQALITIALLPFAILWARISARQPGSVTGPLQIFRLSQPSLLVGLGIAIPLLFFDPDELALIISFAPGETLQWMATATVTALCLGIILAILLPIFSPIINRHKTLTWSLAGFGWLVALVAYFVFGQVGLHGERMLVILNSSADLPTSSQGSDISARRTVVYQQLTQHALASQQPLRDILDRYKIEYIPYYLVNGLEVSYSPILKILLERRPEVDRVINSPRLRPLPQPPQTPQGDASLPTTSPWNLEAIHAPQVWSELGVTGSGIVIGNSDSGADWHHPEVIDSYRGKSGDHTYNWLDPWSNSPEPFDTNGHGTHTLATQVGERTGVAPGATWIACANLVRNLGSPAKYLDCLQFMLAPFPPGGDPFSQGRPDLGAMILNNSWGCPELEGCDPQSLESAVQALRQAGIFIVASAGNEGPSCSSIADPLAIYQQVTSIGALDRNGELASFSSLGPVRVDDSGRIKPDLLAPGVDILSAFPNGTYAIQSGTSMAGPHVVGVVALMWSANPSLIGDIDRTEQILFETAQPYLGELPNCPGANSTPSTVFGYGVVDAYQAVLTALSVP